ncbi:MAG: nucleotidyltransferase family protein [Anaerolineae bacterium]|nr:nucleotidyltransferase family protein [Anaerolineae bacterium]
MLTRRLSARAYGPWPNRAAAHHFLTALATDPAALTDPPAPPLDAAAGHNWLQQHGLAPLAYRWSRSQPLWHSLSQTLAPAYYNNQTATALRQHQLHRLLTGLAAHNIPTLLLKGGALSLTVYPDPALRPMGDVDLWLDRADLPQAWQVAEQVGYHSRGLWAGPEALPERLTQVDFYTPPPEMCLEYHWDLISRPQLTGHLPLTAWWERRRTVVWQGISVQMPDPSAMLLHLCLHQMYQHGGEMRFIWLYDIDRLIRGGANYFLTPDDWETVRQEANQAGILPGVQTALRAAAAWFNTPLPAAATPLLDETPSAAQQAQLQAALSHGAGPANKSWQEIREQPAWTDRLTIIRTKLFPPPAYIRQRYHLQHTWQIPFYYPWRWLKMVYIILTGKKG